MEKIRRFISACLGWAVLAGVPVIAVLVVVLFCVGEPWRRCLPWIGAGSLLVGCLLLLLAFKASRVKESLAAAFGMIYAGAFGIAYFLLGALAMLL